MSTQLESVDTLSGTNMEKFESQTQNFKKSNDLLVMIPVKGALSSISRKLYNVILKESQSQIFSKGVVAGGTFTCPLVDLLEPFAADANDLVKVAKRHFHEMLTTVVLWRPTDQRFADVPHEDQPPPTLGVHGESRKYFFKETSLLEGPGIYMQGKRLYCEWRIPDEVHDRLRDPVLFTQLNIEHLTRLKSYAALALYEICSRYKNNPSGLTCACSPDWWVRALTTKSMDVKPSTKVKTDDAKQPEVKREWRKVKNASVLKAISEINEITDIEVDLIEKKTGKAVTLVQFSVRRKKTSRASKEGTGLSADLVEQATKANVPMAAVLSIVKVSAGGEAVARAAMLKVQQRINNTDLEEINNTGAYARSVARELDGFVASNLPSKLSRQAKEKPEMVVEATITPLSIAKSEVSALPIQEQHDLANRVLADLRNRGLGTPSTIQGHAQFIAGGRLPTHLLVEMARLHASQG